jgi:thiol-disulfide isomerase/thioredoxin
MKKTFFAATVVLLVAASAVQAQTAPPLRIGDFAPKLQTGKFIQGEKVTQFEKGKAYIVEFWATWCPPCRASIPHLSEIAKKYQDKGLIVIGQNCCERDEADKVVPGFVKQMGSKMTYRVALDSKEGSENGKMTESWMSAAGISTIPTAFLVDTGGKISWIGSPFELTDELIEKALPKAAPDTQPKKPASGAGK